MLDESIFFNKRVLLHVYHFWHINEDLSNANFQTYSLTGLHRLEFSVQARLSEIEFTWLNTL